MPGPFLAPTHRKPQGFRWSFDVLLDRWGRARERRHLVRLREQRRAAFDLFTQDLLRALRQPDHGWARALALCVAQVDRIGVAPWHWHAILRRAYAQDRLVEGFGPSQEGPGFAPPARQEGPPRVQRWLWAAVHAQDVWLADRALNDGARANVFLTLEGTVNGRHERCNTLPMTWLLNAQDHGGLVPSWEAHTGLPVEQWPSTWRFWWTHARMVDDLRPMLNVLVRPRRGESLHHHGHRPTDEELRRLTQDAERSILRAALAEDGPAGASEPPTGPRRPRL